MRVSNLLKFVLWDRSGEGKYLLKSYYGIVRVRVSNLLKFVLWDRSGEGT